MHSSDERNVPLRDVAVKRGCRREPSAHVGNTRYVPFRDVPAERCRVRKNANA